MHDTNTCPEAPRQVHGGAQPLNYGRSMTGNGQQSYAESAGTRDELTDSPLPRVPPGGSRGHHLASNM